MTIEEIRSSGLLELYVLGRLGPVDTQLVEDGLSRSSELRAEVIEIEKAFEFYAQAHGVDPDPGLKDKILKDITGNSSPNTTPPASPKSGNPWLTGLLGLSALILVYGFWRQSNRLKDAVAEFDQYRIVCDSTEAAKDAQIEFLNLLNDRNTDIIRVTPTEKYPETDLYFYHNPVNQRNFIKVKNLPDITPNQSYQLWSLKSNQAPIPLDVFQSGGALFIPVSNEANTNTFAITIENLGGAQSPNLANLIGTFTVS
jgi:anti-sigma-K factor RskA